MFPLDELPTQLIVAGGIIAIALVIVNQVMTVAKSFAAKGESKDAEPDVRKMAEQVNDLHEWLGKRDETGAFPWATGPILSKLVEILDRMDRRQERIERDLCDLQREIKDPH